MSFTLSINDFERQLLFENNFVSYQKFEYFTYFMHLYKDKLKDELRENKSDCISSRFERLRGKVIYQTPNVYIILRDFYELEKFPTDQASLLIFVVNNLKYYHSSLLNHSLINMYKVLFRETKLGKHLFRTKSGSNLLTKLKGFNYNLLVTDLKHIIIEDHQIMLSNCGLEGFKTFGDKLEELHEMRREILEDSSVTGFDNTLDEQVQEKLWR